MFLILLRRCAEMFDKELNALSSLNSQEVLVHFVRVADILLLFADDILENVRVTIGESEDNVSGMEEQYLCGYIPGQPPGDAFTVTCTERMYGRFVRVTAVEINNAMSLRELEVYGW